MTSILREPQPGDKLQLLNLTLTIVAINYVPGTDTDEVEYTITAAENETDGVVFTQPLRRIKTTTLDWALAAAKHRGTL